MLDVRLSEAKKQWKLRKDKLSQSIAAAKADLTARLTKLSQQLRSNLDGGVRNFLEFGSSYTIAVVYCESCGHVLNAVSSPRVTTGLIHEQNDKISALFHESLAQSSATLGQLQLAVKKLDELHRVIGDSANRVTASINIVYEALKGVKTAANITALESVQELGDRLGDFLNGPDE